MRRIVSGLRALCRPVLLLAPLALTAAPALAQGGLPRIDQFAANLDQYATTSEALTQWCGKEKIVNDPQVKAEIVEGGIEPPASIRRLLGVRPDVRLSYRHMHLTCHGKVLADGHVWYAPGLLTPEMLQQYSATDQPFDRVSRAMNFTRDVIITVPGANEGCPQLTVYTRRWLLRLPDGRPLALHLECFTRANLKR